MSAFVSHTTVDCRDAYALSEWWRLVLAYSVLEDDPNNPGDGECMIRDPETGHQILFIEVPDPTPGKNRIHFDLRPRSSDRDDEFRSLLAHGATWHEDIGGSTVRVPAG